MCIIYTEMLQSPLSFLVECKDKVKLILFDFQMVRGSNWFYSPYIEFKSFEVRQAGQKQRT